jgi:ferrochelatase
MTPFGVLLMTYGSPASLDDVPAYLERVRGGRAAEPELAKEFTRRYRAIGGSPLVAITAAQAAALEDALGGDAIVRTGMRFSEPSITAGLAELTEAGVSDVAAIILSPQYSPMIMGGYHRAVAGAVAGLQRPPRVSVAGAWHTEPGFTTALATRIREALDAFSPEVRDSVPVLLTAHSLPRRVADDEPDYLRQLTDTADAVAAAAGLDASRWRFCWQSAGHEPGEWMKPDFAELMPELAAAGHETVLVAPVQFLSDHLEILYDIDVGAREQAQEHGLRFARIESLNTSAPFIDALAHVARRTIAADER